MATPQSAILAAAGPFALYALLRAHGDPKTVNARCKAVHDLVDQINTDRPDARLYASIAFSPSYCARAGIAAPASFSAFKPLGSGAITAPATECDVLCHVHSFRHDLNFDLLRKLLSPISREVEILDETYGFRYLDSRDMIGFIDGTENPKIPDEREKVAILPDGEHRGGSFVMIQRFVHQLSEWEKIAVAGQEKVIGRTKADSLELEEVPADSHVGRVDIKENGQGLKIVRHSLPYGSVGAEHGLLFIAYCNSQQNFERMLGSMYGEADGTTDALLQFTRAVTGAFLFAPSMEQLTSTYKRK